MSSFQLKLPPSLERRVRKLAKRDDVSLNQFIAAAVAEKTAAMETADYLRRIPHVSRKQFENALKQVPDVPPTANDRLPSLRSGRP